MPNQSVLKVALNRPFHKLFDYLPNNEPISQYPLGARVKVPFGKRELIGIIMGHATQSDCPIDKLKPVVSLLDKEPLFSQEQCVFFTKAAQYYHHPIGEVVFSGLPSHIRQGKLCSDDLTIPCGRPSSLKTQETFLLNADQQKAIQVIQSHCNQYGCFLLDGVTGSGKTQVYLALASHMIQQHRQVLVLVPEITLTPQTIKRFESHLGGNVAAFHSQITPAQRRDLFFKVKHHQITTVIGTRSALFLPFADLGLIMIDEEHDGSFKQQDGFRYSARDLGVLRAKMRHIPIVLGSATPSFETLQNAKKEKYHWLKLPKRATKSTLPTITLVDVRHKKLTSGLSAPLIEKIKLTLAEDKQVMLFINKRGFAPVYMCYDCGWFATCQRCDTRLTLHLKKNQLTCHHCQGQKKIPSHCPDCDSQALNTVGQGTERLEYTLQHLFPEQTVVRIDRDTTSSKSKLFNLLEQVNNQQANILIGTQMLAKGHHFSQLKLVAVVDADGGLFSTDFRAQERMAQLLIQVSGRAGRDYSDGEVMIQTFHPQHPFMQQIVKQDYLSLANALLEEREQAELPPFSHIALLRASHTNANAPQDFLMLVKQYLTSESGLPQIQIQGPITSPLPKKQGRYQFQLLLQATQRSVLHHTLSKLTHFIESDQSGKRVRWSLDVDPIEMI